MHNLRTYTPQITQSPDVISAAQSRRIAPAGRLKRLNQKRSQFSVLSVHEVSDTPQNTQPADVTSSRRIAPDDRLRRLNQKSSVVITTQKRASKAVDRYVAPAFTTKRNKKKNVETTPEIHTRYVTHSELNELLNKRFNTLESTIIGKFNELLQKMFDERFGAGGQHEKK